MKLNWKAVLAVLVIAGAATGVTLNAKTRGQVVHAWKQMTSHAEEAPIDRTWTEANKAKDSKEPWDRTVSMTKEQLEAIGLRTVPVHTQTDPTNLALFGITDYDPATVTTVRLQFDSRVDKVLVDLGTVIGKDDRLLELFSTDLASAKSDYEAAVSQWIHDKRILDYKTPLINDKTLPEKDRIEIQNDEAQSALKMKLAKDKLLVYGLNNDEIEAAKKEDGKEKAKMILRARADGVVVKRDVVPGNYYDSKDTLLTIAPLDHLWVRGNVSELDADKVEVNQKITVVFPFSHREIESKVDYIDKAIDPDTRSAKFRATIPNPGGKVKAGAFVKVQVHVPPGPGRTVIPRSAMVSVDRTDYVFLRKPGKVATFERRPIIAATENNDIVVVAEPAEGHRELTPGEQVVTLGSLILEQMFEDKLMAEGGLLVSDPAHEKGDHFGQNVVIRTSH